MFYERTTAATCGVKAHDPYIVWRYCAYGPELIPRRAGTGAGQPGPLVTIPVNYQAATTRVGVAYGPHIVRGNGRYAFKLGLAGTNGRRGHHSPASAVPVLHKGLQRAGV